MGTSHPTGTTIRTKAQIRQELRVFAWNLRSLDTPFARDFVDLYAAHQQRHLDWRRLLVRASRNPQNDYNPVEFEDRLRLLDQEFRKGTQELPCERPPAISELTTFLEELRTINADVARELTKTESDLEDEPGIE